MATIIYSTATSAWGPWLLDADAVDRLDKAMDRICERFDTHNRSAIHDAACKRLNTTSPPSELEQEIAQEYPFYRKRRDVICRINENKKSIVSAFRELTGHLELEQEEILGFEVRIEIGELECVISVDHRYGDLTAKVSPEHLGIVRESFVDVQQWIRSEAAPTWQRWWLKLSFFFFIPLLVIPTVFLASLSGLTIENPAIARAQTMLDGGLTDEERTEAIELILRILARPTRTNELVIAPAFWVVSAFLLFIVIVLYFPPVVAVGIGRGYKRLERWKRWATFVAITIPGFFATSFLLPPLIARISTWLGW